MNETRKRTGAPRSRRQASRRPGRSDAEGGLAPGGARSPRYLKFIPLGGIGEVTKNMYVYETASDLVVVDCGIGFPGEDAGENVVSIPDFSYVLARAGKVRGLVVTHGHEDHIGAIPFLLRQLKVPVFAPPLAAGFIRAKLGEKVSKRAKISAVKEGQTVRLGGFSFEYIRLTHSIPDTMAIALETPLGTVIHTGDFKLDPTPLDRKLAELGKIKSLGRDGVLLLVSDCLRAEREGHCSSERIVGETFFREMQRTNGRVFITLFSSDTHRVQQAVDVSRALGRKVTLAGFSLERKAEVARALGYLKVPKNTIVSNAKARKLPQGEITVLAAGSQGQERSAISKMARGTHRFFKIGQGDLVLFSSDIIPGNEDSVKSLVSQLKSRGAKVLCLEEIPDLHVSGHAYVEELKRIILLAKAKYLLPIGGTPESAKAYAQLARALNYRQDQILLGGDGMAFEFFPRGGGVSVRRCGEIPLREIVIHQGP